MPHRVKFMIRDRGSNYTAAFDAVLADAGIRTVLCNEYEIHHNQHRPHRSLNSAASLKPLPEPVDLERYHVRRHARISGMINEYRLVA